MKTDFNTLINISDIIDSVVKQRRVIVDDNGTVWRFNVVNGHYVLEHNYPKINPYYYYISRLEGVDEDYYLSNKDIVIPINKLTKSKNLGRKIFHINRFLNTNENEKNSYDYNSHANRIFKLLVKSCGFNIIGESNMNSFEKRRFKVKEVHRSNFYSLPPVNRNKTIIRLSRENYALQRQINESKKTISKNQSNIDRFIKLLNVEDNIYKNLVK